MLTTDSSGSSLSMTITGLYEPIAMSVVLNDRVNTDEAPESVVPLSGLTDIQSGNIGANNSEVSFTGVDG